MSRSSQKPTEKRSVLRPDARRVGRTQTEPEEPHLDAEGNGKASVFITPQRNIGGTTRGSRAAGGLTGRELEIMLLVAGGNTSRQIGEALFISPRTVEMHVQGSLRKLGCRTRAHAVRQLAELGTLTSGETTRPAGEPAAGRPGGLRPSGETAAGRLRRGRQS
jgi:DNA-binding CsgD family transcriptional regulator